MNFLICTLMRPSALLILLITFALNYPSIAGDGTAHLVRTNSPLSLTPEVFDDQRNGITTTITQPLYYTIMATNDLVDIWLLNQPEYAYQVELFDAKGVKVPKTEKGQKAGSKFHDLSPPELRREIGIRHSVANRPGHGLATIFLFKPVDFFQITNAGDYTLKFEFQFLVREGDFTNKTFNIIRPRILSYKITNPDKTK